MTASPEPRLLTWCPQCDKWTPLHLLVHLIDRHAPRIGDRRAGQHNWRTATLTDPDLSRPSS